MELAGKHVVVTGAASGIGAAMCERFVAEGARGVVAADVDGAGAARVASAIGPQALAISTDVAVEADVRALVERAIDAFGPIDLFCSNAAVFIAGGPETLDEDWQRAWQVNVMAHVYAARAVVPAMVARGEGYLLQTASAAGMLSNLGAAPYTATKHAALGLAEWLKVTYASAGVRVSCLCPLGVRTPMLDTVRELVGGDVGEGEVLDPDAVVDVVVAGLRDERFLILPHPEVQTYWAAKAGNPERWLAAMARIQDQLPGPEAGRHR